MSTAHAVKLPPPLRRRCDGDHKNALFCLVLQKISACMTAKPVACPLSRAGASGSSAATFISTRTCSGCCARAANSRTAAARRAAVQAQRNSVVRRSRTLPPHRSLDNRRQRLHQAAARPVPKGIKRALAALTDEHKIAAKPDLVDSPIRRRCTPTLFPAILGLHPSYPINLTGPVSDRVAARASKLLAPSAVIVMQQLTMIL